jgi:hypothetical protein
VRLADADAGLLLDVLTGLLAARAADVAEPDEGATLDRLRAEVQGERARFGPSRSPERS